MGAIAITAAVLIGPFFIFLAILVVGLRWYLQRKTGVPAASTVQVNPGAALKAIQLALVGNRSMAFEAATQSLQLHLADGSLEQKLMQLGFKDLERRAADPNAKLPTIDYVAHFTGFPRDQVIKFFEAEMGVAARLAPAASSLAPQAVAGLSAIEPTTDRLGSVGTAANASSAPAAASPAAAAPLAAGAILMIALLFTASSSASAASPLTVSSAVVPSAVLAASPLRLPTSYEPTPTPIVIDSPLFYGPVYESQRGQVLLPNSYYAPDSSRLSPACNSCQRCQSPASFNGLWVPQAASVNAQAAAACRLPDKGPVIFIKYYWAPWCEGCKEGNDATIALRDAGWKVLPFNADDESGYVWARADKVAFVPYWIVTVDDRETLRTTNYRTLYDHLSRLRQPQPRYYQTGYEQPTYQQPVYYTNCASGGGNYGNTVGWWRRGPVRRWFAGGGFFRRMFRGRC